MEATIIGQDKNGANLQELLEYRNSKIYEYATALETAKGEIENLTLKLITSEKNLESVQEKMSEVQF